MGVALAFGAGFWAADPELTAWPQESAPTSKQTNPYRTKLNEIRMFIIIGILDETIETSYARRLGCFTV